MRNPAIYFAVVVMLFVCLPAWGQAAAGSGIDEGALKAATHDLCHVQVAMLGESATHGDGHTVAFKAALIERLVKQCGFNRVVFEASHVEFIELNRRLRLGQPVGAQDLLDAVGGLWKFDEEFQPLAMFLVSEAKAGHVFLGGMDDQLGQMGQDYANIAMVAELTGVLTDVERNECGDALHQRIYSAYTDAAPYSEADRTRIETCLSDMQKALAADKVMGVRDKEERDEMVSAAQRWVARGFQADTAYMVNRDRSMFQSFEWLQTHGPRRHKVIVWAATVHIAKQGDPAWGDRTGTNFGLFVHRKYGGQAFSLGFSAIGGSYRLGRRNVRQMPEAPGDSVEAFAMRGMETGAGYVGSAKLAAVGAVPGAFFQHSYETRLWSDYLDGVVVFRTESPPFDLQAK